MQKLISAINGALADFWHYISTDQGFIGFMADVALYSFLLTSIILTVIMLASKPKSFLDTSLTFRQFVLSATIGIGLIARWHGDRLPLWFLTIELLILSIAGILVIVSVLRDYVLFYWERHSR